MKKVISSILLLSVLLGIVGCSSSKEDLKEEAKQFILTENSDSTDKDIYSSLVKKHSQNFKKILKDTKSIDKCIKKIKEPNMKKVAKTIDTEVGEKLMVSQKSIKKLYKKYDADFTKILKIRRKSYSEFLSEMKIFVTSHSSEFNIGDDYMGIFYEDISNIKNEETYGMITMTKLKIIMFNKIKVSNPEILNECLKKVINFKKISKIGTITNITLKEGDAPTFKVPVEYENGDKSEITVYKEDGKWEIE